MPGTIYDRLRNYKPNKATGAKRAGEGQMLPYTLATEAAQSSSDENTQRGNLSGENPNQGVPGPKFAQTNVISAEEEARMARERRSREVANRLPSGRITTLLSGATGLLSTPSIARRMLIGV